MSLKVYGTLVLGNSDAEPIALTSTSDSLEISNGDEVLMTLSSSNMFATELAALERLSESDKLAIAFTATVNYVDLEGGFIGLVTEANEQYIPVNLQSQLEPLVGTSVTVTAAYAEKDAVSIYMWGKLIYVSAFSA